MILVEKFYQKLNNLKSRQEIKDYFIFFDESRKLLVRTQDGGIGKHTHPTHYSEFSVGKYLIVWNDDKVSKGQVTSTSVNSFDEFIRNAKKTAFQKSGEIYIPKRGIFPIVRTFSKSLADMIDVPEYIFKLADILDELDKMTKNTKGYADLEFREGKRYVYSSYNLDEYYPYTEFSLIKTFKGFFNWKHSSSDVYSISKFHELLSFLGDIYISLKSANPIEIKSGNQNVILPPHIFQSIFNDQIINNLDGDNILLGRSVFKINDFIERKKVFGSMSLVYDPLINLKKGSYSFTSDGYKAQRQYFIKYGKLDIPILNNINYSLLGYTTPTVEILDFGNIKLEGLKKSYYHDIIKNSESFIYVPDIIKKLKKSKQDEVILTPKSLFYDNGTTKLTSKLYFKLNLANEIQNGNVELVEFVDGQIGAKILNLPIKFV